MWISKDVYDYMHELLIDYQRKIKQYEILLNPVQSDGQIPRSSVVLDGKCVLLNFDTFCEYNSNETRLQEEIKKLEAERDFFKYQYAYEKFAKEMDDIDVDWKQFAEVLKDFVLKNSTFKEDQGGPGYKNRRNSEKDFDSEDGTTKTFT